MGAVDTRPLELVLLERIGVLVEIIAANALRNAGIPLADERAEELRNRIAEWIEGVK
jgi:hypothetical protein